MREAVVQAIGPAAFEWMQSHPISFWLKYIAESSLLTDTILIFLFLLFASIFVFLIPFFFRLIYTITVRKYYGESVAYQLLMLTGFFLFALFLRMPYFQMVDLFSNRTNEFNEAASLFLMLNIFFPKIRFFTLAMLYGAKELAEDFNRHLDETNR